MIASVGVAGSAGVGAALIIGVSILPTIAIQFVGGRLGRKGESQTEREHVEVGSGDGSLEKD
jgi:hypothetical protein